MRSYDDAIHINSTLAQQIRAALTEHILRGALPPGTPLYNSHVAAEFGTSNTRVREALRLLEKDGLVDLQLYRGCVVRLLDPDEIAEIFDVRIALESYAIWTAASKITDEQLDQLEALIAQHEALIAAGDLQSSMDAGAAIHLFLLEAAGNQTLLRVIADLSNPMRIARHVYMRHVGANDVVPYRQILDALRAHDEELAASLMSAHIKHARDQVVAALRAMGREAFLPRPHRRGKPGLPLVDI